MDGCMVISGGANQFSVRRHRQNPLHPFQVNWTHMLNRFDELLLLDAAEQCLFALQNGRSHKHSSLSWMANVQVHISIWTYQIVRCGLEGCQGWKQYGSPSLRGKERRGRPKGPHPTSSPLPPLRVFSPGRMESQKITIANRYLCVLCLYCLPHRP